MLKTAIQRSLVLLVLGLLLAGVTARLGHARVLTLPNSKWLLDGADVGYIPSGADFKLAREAAAMRAAKADEAALEAAGIEIAPPAVLLPIPVQ